MNDAWPWRSLGELFDIGAGKTMSAAARSGAAKTPFLRTSNVLWDQIDLSSVDEMSIPEHELPAKLLRSGDLLICEGGEIGRAAIWNGEVETMSFQNHLHRLRPVVEEVESRFYVYFLQCAFTQLGIFEGAGNKTTIPNLSRSRLAALHVPQPMLDEQQAITTALARVRDAIRIHDQSIALALDLKRATMRSLFTHGLRGEVQKETEIGPVPESWEIKTLLELCEIWSGGTPRKSIQEYWGGKIPWVSGKDLKSPVLDDAMDHVTVEGAEAGSRLAPSGAVLLLVRGMGLAKDLPVAVINRPMAFNQDIKALVSRGNYPGTFLRSAIYTGKERLLKQIVPSAHGTMTLTLNDVENFKVPCPPDETEIDEIVAIIDAINRKIDLHRRKRAAIEDLFKSLLHKLMTGEIRVTDLDLSPPAARTHGLPSRQKERQQMRDEKEKISKVDHHGAMSVIDNQASFRRNLPNPRDLMRLRHPDLYSDTQVDDIPRLPKEVFEHHLDTLTSRKQEYQFEHFCRKLAEKEICPNLRVQTGPTGGGDSKVDTETYPVAEEIAERWWIGSPLAGAERWAFAFSAKKDWKSKVKADVKSILSTGRDYKLIYFFTNQFVSDKQRSSCEGTLSQDAGIPVHIVDRAWIVEKVYEADHRHIETYFAALGIENVQRERTTRIGPRDTARLEELEELDRQVSDPQRYQGARYQLVEDCLRSAILARSLDRARNEVESRFAQADRLTLDVNSNQQRLRIAYNCAWTAFWWYEDYAEFGKFYESVEQRAEKSVQASDVDLLFNLWMLLLPSMAVGRIETQDAKIEARSQRLDTMLQTMATDTTRPNNALQARTSLILMRTAQAYHSRRFDEVEDGWRQLTEVVEKSEGLGAYSLEHLFNLVRELGEYVDGPAFDVLYDKLADAMRKRCSDGEAGVAYLSRARQKMGQEKPYEAIQRFGRAEELLIKEEYRGKLVAALIGVSCAFEQVGLLWAARNKALAAADRTLEWFVKEGKLIPQAMTALNRLVWIELRLGRIPHILDAITLASSVAANLNVSEEQQKAYDEELQMQESVLGIHLLNLPLTALSSATRLPSILQRLGLESARMALLFALGQEQVLREDGYIPVEEDAETVQTFFEQWQDQPAAKGISSRPVLVEGKTSVLKSTILGSEIVVETPNNETSFGVAESLLGALEAFLSTSDEQAVFPYREQMTIVITESAQLEGIPRAKFSDNDSSRVEIVHPIDLDFTGVSDRQNYMEWLEDSLVQITCRILMIRDIGAWFEQVANRERGFSRAVTLGDALTLDRNVFGKESRMRLADWLEQNDESYPLLRNEPWCTVQARAPKEPPKFATKPPPKDLNDKEQLRHTDRRIFSPIDIPLWDRAKWRGTLYVSHPDGPPILAIGFEDGEAGQAIFRVWKERWGDVDKDDDLRVAIITGLSKQSPAEYAVVVGPNLRHVPEDENKRLLFVSRIHRMTPNNLQNLETFIQFHNRMGYFFLAPAQINADGNNRQMPSREFAFLKRKLDVRQAWQIGENDPDIAVLHKDDEPIVPEGVTDPPVNSALRRIRSLGL